MKSAWLHLIAMTSNRSCNPEFKVYSAQPGEFKSESSNFGFIDHQETAGGEFEERRVMFSSVARRHRHETERGETR